MTEIQTGQRVIAFHGAVCMKSPDDPYFENPYHNIQLKLFYPVRWTSMSGRQEAIPDTRFAPFPVVILLPQIRGHWTQYEWLATEIAAQGYVVAIPDWYIENEDDGHAINDQIRLEDLAPETSHQVDSSTAVILPILEGMRHFQRRSPIAGLINLDAIVLGGHSVGGALALMNANPKIFPQVKAAFAWCPLTSLIGVFDRQSNRVMNRLSPDVPMLIMGASDDVVDISLDTFDLVVHDDPGKVTDQLLDLFRMGIRSAWNDKLLAILPGSRNFTIYESSSDDTDGYAYIDGMLNGNHNYIRLVIADLIIAYLNAYVLNHKHDLEELDALLNDGTKVIHYERK